MKKYLLSFIVLAPALLACNKVAETPGGGVAGFSVSVNIPDTKVSFDDGGQLYWEGEEAVSLLFGNDNSIDGNNRLTARLEQGDKLGVFSGEVNLGSFSPDHLRGVVYPYNPDHFYRRNGASYRIVMQIGGTMDENKKYHQIQYRDNVLNGDNIALFSVLYPEDAVVENGKYIIDGKQFSWGCSLVRFNIYGKGSALEADEVLKSVEIAAQSGSSIAGRQEWKIEAGEFIWNGVSNNVQVEMQEPYTLADRDAENGVKVFMTLMSRSFTLKQGTVLTIHTDKGDYPYTFPADLAFDLSKPGHVKKVGIDLSASYPYIIPSDPNKLPSATWIDEDVWTPAS